MAPMWCCGALKPPGGPAAAAQGGVQGLQRAAQEGH
ncbi:hypothetical protein HaLaN_03164 [Haematococcus lacustris]|uniref:Uncharacterized protein n=1 Tax=Haematococcus lacustris TaxID=44745 RepID=A0A699YDW6_HAELA|nr:hypothetical protein HaLaN_03164 [Haematococcus lacustris]